MSNNPEVASRLTTSVQQLGTAVINIVTSAAACQNDDDITVRNLSDAGREVSEKVITHT
jgi:hypothetical protein